MQYISKRPKTSQKRPKTSQNIPKRPKTSQNAIASWYGCIIFRTSWNLFENSDAINWFYCIMLWTSLNLAQPRPKFACLSQHNTAKHSNMSKNVPKRAKMPQNIPQRFKMSQNMSWKSHAILWRTAQDGQNCQKFCSTKKIDPENPPPSKNVGNFAGQTR